MFKFDFDQPDVAEILFVSHSNLQNKVISPCKH